MSESKIFKEGGQFIYNVKIKLEMSWRFSMKRIFKIIALVVAILIIGIWQLYKTPFNQLHDSNINANLYKDGVRIGDTTVSIYGQKSNYLFHDSNRFEGKFIIPSYEITYSGLAIINRMLDTNMHELWYAQVDPFMAKEIVAPILINDNMNTFALMTIDGTVIATSDEMNELYTKHVQAYEGGTNIEHIDEVPKIE